MEIKRKKEEGRNKERGEKQKFFLLIPFYLFLLTGCLRSDDWINSLPKPWTLSEEQVSKILPQFYEHYPDFHDRLKAFALWQVGKPYEIFKLGEEVEPDPDPIIRLDVSDCTVHVLTSLAFSQSKSWSEARKNMITIHYKDGQPSYKSRWHYTSNRIQENPYTIKITEELLNEDLLEKIDITLNRKENGNEFLDLDWEKETTIYYIPNEEINKELISKFPDVCGVAFVKKAYFKMGIIIAHEGMVINKKNLIHASSEYGKTVNVDFMDYYFRDDGPLFDGLMIYSFYPLQNK
ncbi:MAG: DUF1460 domain-containing protein [Candidatus Marinimicrobia bacterium]|nr:DUF1460 domain-containing protein [Candidatus Neomarinimicrobiota bacterium]